ncbi:MAG: DUF1080 domain-containing protein [Candidatus Neomarinimicrobiota bacterium]|nr:DUF1080 domain-containing protein [Candidatus Neomarinimicrobiota bacterium]
MLLQKTVTVTVLLFIADCSSQSKDWVILFDGQKVTGMRGYKMENFPWDGWKIEDGTLKTLPNGKGVDIISTETYKDFELELEWKVKSGGNSGIFYFATEKDTHIWQSAPEMQVLDNIVHTDGKKTVTSAGALYDLIAPSETVVNPVGEFNQVRILSKDNTVSHWLNGTKILEYEYGSDNLKKLINKSKFKDMPYFAKVPVGSIGLQGDHGEVWYRNIRVRRF